MTHYHRNDDTAPIPVHPSMGEPAEASPHRTPFTSGTGPSSPRHRAQPEPDLRLPERRRASKVPWRRIVRSATGLNLGESARERARRELVDRVKQPVGGGPFTVAVLSQKGGVGKTTTVIGLGSALAATRGDRVIAVDANPDFGTLAQRGPLQTRSTVRDVLMAENILRYSDMREHTSQGSSRLEVLASERDPATSEAFSEEDYRGVLHVLQRFYNIILTDCGTGLVHSAMAGVLSEADLILVVASPSVDSARSGLATVDWLQGNGYSYLMSRVVVVVNAARPGGPGLDMEHLRHTFLSRVRGIHSIPFDSHLAEGAVVDLKLVGHATRQAYLELAAEVVDGFVDVLRASDASGRP